MPSPAQVQALMAEIQAVVKGFQREADNGVICVPKDDEFGMPQWDAEPHRTWCASCKSRWQRLFAVAAKAKELEAVLRESPPPTWRCFHCDEVFTDKAEAREHFGETLDDDPLCKIKADEGGLAGEIRRLNVELSEAYRDRNSYENDARLWHEAEADRVRRIGHCQWWQELDSRDGERLVLQERIVELEKLVLESPPPHPQTDDVVCRHGIAMDVHCCHCHSGFIFDKDHECPPTMADAAEMLWIVLANVSGGDWTKQTPEWQEAAARWRDNYFAALRTVGDSTPAPSPTQDPTPEGQP
jgi:hypothetical protein